jgi:hypothetical protein
MGGRRIYGAHERFAARVVEESGWPVNESPIGAKHGLQGKICDMKYGEHDRNQPATAIERR